MEMAAIAVTIVPVVKTAFVSVRHQLDSSAMIWLPDLVFDKGAEDVDVD